jgi:hypothetical protein
LTRFRSEGAWLAALLGAAVLLRVLLVAWSPTPFGYVWDSYYIGVQVLYERGRLPIASDCWQCYHPPLFYLLGWPLYAAGRAIGGSDAAALRGLGLLPLACGAVTTYFGYRLLRLFRRRGVELVFGVGLLLTFPCLFISSYGAEADIVVTAILSALVFYLVRDAAEGPPSLWPLARLGALAGLAAATKYSGLVGVATVVSVLAWHAAAGRRRGLAMEGIGVVVVLTAMLGGWKYLDNARWHGTPLHANGSAVRSFSLDDRGAPEGHYEFLTLRLTELAAAVSGEVPPGRLTDLPVYRSVPTALHGLAWSDLGFFSYPTRHGDPGQPYPRKRAIPAVTIAVLFLAFVPEALAAAGAWLTLRRRRFLPLVIFCLLSAASYTWPRPSGDSRPNTSCFSCRRSSCTPRSGSAGYGGDRREWSRAR